MSKAGFIVITEKAAEKIAGIKAKEGREKSLIRVSLVRTNCMGGRGHTYRLAFEDNPLNGDKVFEERGLPFCIDSTSAKHVVGSRIDYVEDLSKQGFIVDNPNAAGKCPCGHHDLFLDA